LKTIKRNPIVIASFLILFFINTISLAQNYRNPKAYINDFVKNELFVKESLAEYSSSIINISSDIRIQATLDKIYAKLENINKILIKNDKGVFGDTELRDAFIQLNAKTITLLRNKSLILNDYTYQSSLSYADIFKNFISKENEITDYYRSLIAYENNKRHFALKYNINLKNNAVKKNLFEYNAYQNIIYYEMNVLDEKLMALLKEKNIAKVSECMKYIEKVGEEGLRKTDSYKNDFKDTSLNNANVEFINFILQQKESLLPLYNDYIKSEEALQIVKIKIERDNKSVSIEEYNSNVRKFNNAKNVYFDTLYTIQNSKNELIKSWTVTNGNFLKNNSEFESKYEKLSSLD